MAGEQRLVLRGARAGDVFPSEILPQSVHGYCTIVRLPHTRPLPTTRLECVNEDDLCAQMKSVCISLGGEAANLIPERAVEQIRNVWEGDIRREELVMAGVLWTKNFSALRFHILVPWMPAESEYVYFVYSENEGLMLPLVLVKGSGGPHRRCLYSFNDKQYK